MTKRISALLGLFPLLLGAMASPAFAQDPCPEVALIATGGQRYLVFLKDTTVTPADSVVVQTRGLWDKALEDVVAWRRARDTRRYEVFAVPSFRSRGECRGVTIPPDSMIPPPVDTLPSPPVDTVTPPPVDSGPPVPPPPPVDSTPTPPAIGYRFVPQERFDTWAAMRAANHPFWVEAVTDCAKTGTASEGYADNGEWCALVAATTRDATAAAKAIAKLRQITTGADANEVREYFLARILQRDLLSPWLTSADYAAIDPILDQWTSRANTILASDSDQMTGNGCGAILWDQVRGTATNRSNVTTAISRYVALAAGGQWIESAEYNMGTVVLLAQCNLASRTALGRDIVPGVSAFLAEAGTVAAFEVTPDLKEAMAWGDDQYPRDLRLYRRAAYLSALPSPLAQGTLQAFLAKSWPFSHANLMPRALFLAHPDLPPATPPMTGSHVATGMGMLYRTDGPISQWAMVLPKTGVHHTDITAPMDLQVYRNGWLLTGSIGYGYGVHELGQNAPVYAGLNLFTQSGMTWADSGNGWAAIAGVTKGAYFTTGYPGPPPFLRYGGRVVVEATVHGDPVLIVRDSVDMDDPRTLANYSSYRSTGTYPHQQRIVAFDGAFWSLWHMPQQPTVVGNEVRWTAATNEAVKVTTCQSVQVAVVNEQGVVTGTIQPSEVRWQARLRPTGPVLVQVFSLASETVSCAGSSVTVGGQSWTLTASGVTGP